MSHAVALLEVLAEQTVGVLGGAALPGVVGGGEVDEGAGGTLDVLVGVELGAVVEGEGVGGSRGVVDELDGAAVEGLGGTVGELAEQDEAGTTVDEGEDAGASRAAEDGVALKVTDAGSEVGLEGTLGDHALAGEAAAAVIRAIVFSPLPQGASEVAVELPPAAPVLPDVAVDGLMADGEQAVAREAARDLLGAPVVLEGTADEDPVLWDLERRQPARRSAVVGR